LIYADAALVLQTCRSLADTLRSARSLRDSQFCGCPLGRDFTTIACSTARNKIEPELSLI